MINTVLKKKKRWTITHQITSHLGMPHEELWKQELQSLLDLKLIRPSKSQWTNPAFYVNKNFEQVCGRKRLVIDYKNLNDRLQEFGTRYQGETIY